MVRAFTAAALRARRTAGSRIANLLIASVLVATAACSGSDSSTGPGNTNPVGTYVLAQIDKKPIPFEIYRGTFDVGVYTFDPYIQTVTGGKLDLLKDGTYILTIEITNDLEGDKYRNTFTDDGTYEIQGTRITINSAEDGWSGTATLSGNSVTLGLELGEEGTMRGYAFRLVQ
jgi:hypothetical protein